MGFIVGILIIVAITPIILTIQIRILEKQ